MTQPQAFPSARDGRRQEGLFNRSAERFRQVVALSALLGLAAGIGEALIDLATPPFSAPDVLYVTVAADLMVFLVVGLLFWVLVLGLKPKLAYFLVLFVLLWVLLHGWESEFAPHAERSLLWLLGFAGTCLIAVLLSVWASRHMQKVARIVSQTLPWIIGIMLASFVAIPLYRLEVRHRAMSSVPRAAGNLPNVVLIVVDALRADHLSYYGYDRLTSPNFDRFAANGVLFENAIAPSSWTLPSHASMLTGLYPNQHRAQRIQDRLGGDVLTLPEELERAGYSTAAFSGSFFFTPRQGLGRGFIEFGDLSYPWTQALTQSHYIASILEHLGKDRLVRENSGQPSGIAINESVIRWIDKIHSPFFLAVNYFEVHEPGSIPEPWRQRFSAEIGRTVSQVTPQIQRKIDEYDSAIAYDDDRLQRLIDELGRRHLMDNTLLIVTADHGEGLGEHGLFVHGTALYYPLIHVPLIFYWPGHLPAGLRIKRPVSTKDIGATILELLSASHSQLPGKSLAALWNAQTLDQWPMPVSELVPLNYDLGKPSGHQGEIESIISSDFQLILDPNEGSSLYNWQQDPQERESLFFSLRYETLGRELVAELKRNE